CQPPQFGARVPKRREERASPRQEDACESARTSRHGATQVAIKDGLSFSDYQAAPTVPGGWGTQVVGKDAVHQLFQGGVSSWLRFQLSITSRRPMRRRTSRPPTSAFSRP